MRSNRTGLARAVVVAVMVAVGAGPVVATPAQADWLGPYRTVDLGFAGRSTALNDDRQVVGELLVGSGFDIRHHPFLWEQGRYTDLGLLNPDARYGRANDINNGGQVVGQSEVTDGVQHAFLWEHGVMTDLGTLGGEWSAATRINDRGQIIGFSQNAAGAWRSFLWQDGVMTDLGAYGVNDINNRGQLAGLDLGPGTETAINNAGIIVGYLSNDQTETNEAYLWRAGEAVNIGVPGRSTSALDINDRGEVLMETIGGLILWRDGEWALLNELGVPTIGNEVVELNNRGDIVGSAYDSDWGVNAMVYLR